MECNFALIVPTLNPGQDWYDWVEALEKQRLKPRRVLVLDSMSDDDVCGKAKEKGYEVYSIAREVFDHGGTRQQAVLLLDDSDVLVFMTQDAILSSPEALEKLVAVFDDARVGAAYGRQVPRVGAGPIEEHARLFNYPEVGRVSTLDDTARLGMRAAFISNSFAAYRRAALLEAGGFPDRVILSEDMIAAARLLLCGWSIVYQPEACVRHSHNFTVAQEARRYFDIGVLHSRQNWLLERIGKPEGEGLRFLRSQITFLLENRPLMIPAAAARALLKYAAYRMGRAERWLPRNIKKRFSSFKGFWER